MVQLYTEEERGEFVAAIDRHRGNLSRARKDLGLAHKTFYRYIVRFRLWETIDRARGVDVRGVDYEALYAAAKPHHAPGDHLREAARRRHGTPGFHGVPSGDGSDGVQR